MGVLGCGVSVGPWATFPGMRGWDWKGWQMRGVRSYCPAPVASSANLSQYTFHQPQKQPPNVSQHRAPVNICQPVSLRTHY